MDWLKYFKYVAGACLIVAGVYYLVIGDFDTGMIYISAGFALFGFSATLDIWVTAKVKSLGV